MLQRLLCDSSCRKHLAFRACSVMFTNTDLVRLLLPLAVGFGEIQRSLPVLLLVRLQIWRRHPAVSTVMERGRRGGRGVRGAHPGAGAWHTALSFDGLLHAQVQRAVLVHLYVHFLEEEISTEIKIHFKVKTTIIMCVFRTNRLLEPRLPPHTLYCWRSLCGPPVSLWSSDFHNPARMGGRC